MQGFVHPVVFGNEIGRFSIDLIERYAKAWDSTKSPSILKLPISFPGTTGCLKFCSGGEVVEN